MEFESELSQGRKSEKKIIKSYCSIINEFGVHGCHMGKMYLYELTGERANCSSSYVRRVLTKYFKGEIKP